MLWPLPCERKHRHFVTSGNPSMVRLTLASGVVVHRLLPSGYRAFAACWPPGFTVLGFVTIPRRSPRIIGTGSNEPTRAVRTIPSEDRWRSQAMAGNVAGDVGVLRQPELGSPE
jgi:hypothetical protein